MHWLLFIHKILFSPTCFEHQVLIFRRTHLYTCSIWYCHSLWEFLVVCRYTAWVNTQRYKEMHLLKNLTEKIKTHLMFSNVFFRKLCRLWDNVVQFCRAGKDTDWNIIRHTRIACWIPKAPNTKHTNLMWFWQCIVVNMWK